MALIELREIAFAYSSGPWILKGVDFTLEEGERIGLLGGNGSGKTTLLNIILGLLAPARGEITILGHRCRGEADFREVRRRVGLLFQDADDQLFSPTVLEDVAFGPLNLGLPRGAARERAEETLEQLGIGHLRDRVPYHLSGGEKRLASLAAVLAMRPEILLLDEPTGGLDEAMTRRVLHVLSSYPARGWMLISHDREVLDAAAEKRYQLTNRALAVIEAGSPRNPAGVSTC